MNDNSPQSAHSPDQKEMMERFGIRHVMADVFHYRDYRYTRLDDAVAQAIRDRGGVED